MLPIIGIVCALSSSCTSSISLLGGGGAAFAAWRARLSGAGGGAGDSGGGAPGTPPPRPPPRPQSQAPRSGKRIGRGAQNAAKAAAQRAQAAARAAARRAKAVARAAARRTQAAARRARNAAKAAARRARNAIRARARKAKRAARAAARRIKKVFRRPRFRRIRRPRFTRRRRPRFGRRRRCFSPETLIKLQNGETRAMKNIELGDILINGSIVKATMQIKNENDPYYKIPSKDLNTDILVTGSHYIQSSTRFIRVSKFNGSVATQKIDPVVNCIITSDHKVPIGEYIFWDWEDQYVK
jgi:archaellum component FlaF (FlaF/FlaG flagellin family)